MSDRQLVDLVVKIHEAFHDDLPLALPAWAYSQAWSTSSEERTNALLSEELMMGLTTQGSPISSMATPLWSGKTMGEVLSPSSSAASLRIPSRFMVLGCPGSRNHGGETGSFQFGRVGGDGLDFGHDEVGLSDSITYLSGSVQAWKRRDPVSYLHGGSIRVGIKGNDLDPVVAQERLRPVRPIRKGGLSGRGLKGVPMKLTC